jgi:N-acetylmuramoyl-L-alanine amidase
MSKHLHPGKFVIILIVVALLFALVVPAAAQNGNGVITNASRVNLRTGPGAGFPVITVLSSGQLVYVASRNADGSWLQVQVVGTGTLGWVNARYVYTNVNVGGIGVSQPTGAQNAVTSTDYLNIRNGPGANFDTVGRLAYGQAVNVIGRNADSSWVQITVPGGVTGWVSSRYVSASVAVGNLPITSNTGVFPTYPQPVPTTGQTGIITAVNLNVRYGPGTWFGAFDRLHRGEGVSLVGRSGNSGWLLVQMANGATGWVSTGFVSTNYPIASLPVSG